MLKHILLLLTFVFSAIHLSAQNNISVEGTITDLNGKPIEFATVIIKGMGVGAVANSKGQFVIKNIPSGRASLRIECLGFAAKEIAISVADDMKPIAITLQEDNLKLDEVEVVASSKIDEGTTSYSIGRMAMDNQQVMNIADLSSLLPGGQTINSTLMNDSRLSLRALASEQGNASFGTAIEIDGIRLGNNATLGETAATSTRNISSASIDRVEIIPGVASVEYGDMSNGIVKVHTRRGRSPFIVEGKLNQHTRQVAVSKGWVLNNGAMFNATLEHARSFSDAASPHTAYQRNALTLNYQNTFFPTTMPLTFEASAAMNVGGYKSTSDPDRELDSYARQRDNAFRGALKLGWQPSKSWLSRLDLQISANFFDRLTTDYSHTSSASTQPYIHSAQEGYFIAQKYENNPSANIILGPTGYWYVLGYNASKPLDVSAKLKAQWNHKLGAVSSNLKAGLDYTWSHNSGRGTYYADMSVAPTYRPYSYDELPALRTLGLYVEEFARLNTIGKQRAELTIGLRRDETQISGSVYGNLNAWSPRGKLRYVFVDNSHGVLRHLSAHASMGKSAKLPSFQVLYPREAYSDHLSFSSPSTADATSFYAYHTYPSVAIRNSNLQLQYARQIDLGVQANIAGTRITLSYYHTKTQHPYMATRVFTPFSYRYTSPSEAQTSAIPSANREYSIDQNTGVVTISDRTGALPEEQLSGRMRNTYLSRTTYTNASSVTRQGLEWVIDFAQIRPLRTSLRLDGNYYWYKGLDETLFADAPSLSMTGSNGELYSYIGYYRGANATSASYTANASATNGAISKRLNLNATVTTHIPKLRLIMALRIESTLYRYSRALSQYKNGTRGVVVESGGNFGYPYTGTERDARVAVYPEYYSTWDNPNELIPFAERYAWARDNDAALYSDLTQLVARTNYGYTLNPNKISSYWSANFSVTKEIGDHVQVSFYANNFINTMKRVRSSQTDIETSLFASGYVPSYYYGLSVKLKL